MRCWRAATRCSWSTTSRPARRETCREPPRLEQLDIVDGPALAARRRSFAPSVVCHLAAQASVVVSVEAPERDLAVNVQGHVQRRAGGQGRRCARRVRVHRRRAVRRERAASQPRDDARRAAVALRRLQARRRGIRRRPGGACTGFRTSCCGSATCTGRARTPKARRGSWRSSATCCRRGSAPTVFGDGRQTRDYIYVTDVAKAFALAADARARGDAQRRPRKRELGARPARGAPGLAPAPVAAGLRAAAAGRAAAQLARLDAPSHRRSAGSLAWTCARGLQRHIAPTPTRWTRRSPCRRGRGCAWSRRTCRGRCVGRRGSRTTACSGSCWACSRSGLPCACG